MKLGTACGNVAKRRSLGSSQTTTQATDLGAPVGQRQATSSTAVKRVLGCNSPNRKKLGRFPVSQTHQVQKHLLAKGLLNCLVVVLTLFVDLARPERAAGNQQAANERQGGNAFGQWIQSPHNKVDWFLRHNRPIQTP